MRLNNKVINCLILITMLFSGFYFGFINVYAADATKKITVTKVWNDEDNILEFRPTDITVHIETKSSYLIDGPSLESKMKTLSGSGDTNTDNTTITAIKKATDEQYNAKKSSLTSNNEVQTSGEKTYMWYEDGTIYFYSEADNIFLNANSGGTFRKMKSLTDISGLASFNTSYVTDMNRIFQDSLNLENITPISGWNTSFVTDFTFSFGSSNTANSMSIKSFEALRNWNVSNVLSFNQTFKACKQVATLEPLKDWNVSKVTNVTQMFNWSKSLTTEGLDYIKNWDVKRVSNFNNMTNNLNTGVARPDFTKRPPRTSGSSWNTSGTYYPQSEALAPATPDVPPTYSSQDVYTTSPSGWKDNGDGTWTYEFTVPNDNSTYVAWEEPVDKYTSDALENSKKDVSDDAITITNSLPIRDITVTKVWNDNSDYYEKRPGDITVHLVSSDNSVDKTSGTWIDNGDNTWKYIYKVYGDSTIYNVYEDAVVGYTSDAISTSPKAITSDAATITNTLDTNDLVLNSIVKGNMADTNDEFTYTITIYDENDNPVAKNVMIDGISTSLSSGSFTKVLKHGESVIIQGLPTGYKYKITETDTDYNESFNIEKEAAEDESESGTDTGIVTLTENHTITFNNTKEASVMTGVSTSKIPYIIMIGISLIVIETVLIFKKLKLSNNYK